MPRPVDLPDYDSPPLDEVVFATRFLDLEKFTDTDQILFWQSVVEEFPTFSNQPRVTIVDDATDGGSSVDLAALMSSSQGPSRLFMTSADDVFVLQLQNNMLVSNWRLRDGHKYPHFDSLHERFARLFERFCEFLDSRGIDRPRATSLELTYVNWIPGADLERAFQFAQHVATSGRGVNRQPTAQVHVLKYRLVDSDDAQIGVLSVELRTAKRPDGPGGATWVDGTMLSLSARVSADDSDAPWLDAFEGARDTIVQTFTDLTTEEARRTWLQK